MINSKGVEVLPLEKALTKAIVVATKAHDGQVDKSWMPYISHVMRVSEACGTVTEKVVAVLHDIIEDTDWNAEMLLNEGFSDEVVDAVVALTKVSDDEEYDVTIERVKTNPIAVRVKLCDLTDNMDIRRFKELKDRDFVRLQKYLKAYKDLTNFYGV